MEHYTNEEVLAKVDRIPRSATEIYASLAGIKRDADGHLPMPRPRRTARKHVGQTLEYLSRKGEITRVAVVDGDREIVHFWRR